MTDATEVELKKIPHFEKQAETFKIMLKDSYGDGWNGNVLSIYQEGYFPQNFGASFTSGKQNQVSIELVNGIPAEVIVVKKG